VTLKSGWEAVGEPVDPDSTERYFFTEHGVEHRQKRRPRGSFANRPGPGRREARVVVFIDRYAFSR